MTTYNYLHEKGIKQVCKYRKHQHDNCCQVDTISPRIIDFSTKKSRLRYFGIVIGVLRSSGLSVITTSTVVLLVSYNRIKISKTKSKSFIPPPPPQTAAHTTIFPTINTVAWLTHRLAIQASCKVVYVFWRNGGKR